MKVLLINLILVLALGLVGAGFDRAANVDRPARLKALIIDGQNNHGGWPKTTMMMKDYLEETGMFDVDIYRTSNLWIGPHNDGEFGSHDATVALLNDYSLGDDKEYTIHEEPISDPAFLPDFEAYDVVVSNFGWKTAGWPDKTNMALEDYVRSGGGFVVVHAANNCFGDWDAYNKMIGLGGWGGRDASTGPYVFYNKEGQVVRDPSEGPCGNHGPQHEFRIKTRAPEHPIMRGLPTEWMHSKDELYELLRGPAERFTILATAYAPQEDYPNGPDYKGSGRHEPALMAVEFGEGRVFHTILGHVDYSMECVGFITTLQRGAEWVATGKVTQKVPDDFPPKDEVSVRPWKN